MLKTVKPYTILLPRKTPVRLEHGADKTVWEHGRTNFELRRDGPLRIVLPLSDERDLTGICIFSSETEETKRIMDSDPAVKAGIFTYEVYSGIRFPGDSLP